MATDGQFYWPSVGIFMAAYEQFFMAADTAIDTHHFEAMTGRHTGILNQPDDNVRGISLTHTAEAAHVRIRT